MHGVNGAMRAKAAVAITETKIREKLERYGDLDDVTRADPLNGLLRRVVTADAMVRVLTEQVAELDSQAIADAAVMHLLGEWSDRHARYCKLAVDAGVDVQRLAMTQAMGQMIVALLRTLVTDLADRLGWTPDVMQVANEVVRTHLVALEAG